MEIIDKVNKLKLKFVNLNFDPNFLKNRAIPSYILLVISHKNAVNMIQRILSDLTKCNICTFQITQSPLSPWRAIANKIRIVLSPETTCGLFDWLSPTCSTILTRARQTRVFCSAASEILTRNIDGILTINSFKHRRAIAYVSLT